jgi:hypothetical protein
VLGARLERMKMGGFDALWLVIPAHAGIQVFPVGADLRVRPRLDTRSPIKVGDKLRGYDGSQAPFFEYPTCIFEGGTKDAKESNR